MGQFQTFDGKTKSDNFFVNCKSIYKKYTSDKRTSVIKQSPAMAFF